MRRSSCKESPKTQRRQPIELNAWLSARPVHVPAQTPTDPPFLPAWTETPLTRFSPLRSRCAVQIGCRYADRTVTRLSVQYAEWRVQNAPGGRQPVADSSSIIPKHDPAPRHGSSYSQRWQHSMGRTRTRVAGGCSKISPRFSFVAHKSCSFKGAFSAFDCSRQRLLLGGRSG